MGQKPLIDRVRLNEMLRRGKSQRDIAISMGVSEAAISKAKKELNINVVKTVALENAHRVVDKNLDALGQLEKINKAANKMLDELTGEDRTINRMVKAVEGVLSFEGDPKKQGEQIRKVILLVSVILQRIDYRSGHRKRGLPQTGPVDLPSVMTEMIAAIVDSQSGRLPDSPDIQIEADMFSYVHGCLPPAMMIVLRCPRSQPININSLHQKSYKKMMIRCLEIVII